MGNIPLSAEDINFLKEKGNNEQTTSDIKKAFKEFSEGLDTNGKSMQDVKINFDQFCTRCDMVFNTHAETLNRSPPQDKDSVYRHLFRAFDRDTVRISLKKKASLMKYFVIGWINQF